MTPRLLERPTATLERAKTLLAVARLATAEDQVLVRELAEQLMRERREDGRFGSDLETLVATLALQEAGAL
jgi:hypothetical protein